MLHYFDVLPTAGVATRATGLQAYLAKRVARGELAAGDIVALVGHSTGGLDIRRLILDLDARTRLPINQQAIRVDGPRGGSFTVAPTDLLRMVRRLVFLSVPQWGTNIADWVRGYTIEREALVAQLRASVFAASVPLVDKIEAWFAGNAAKLAHADLFLAVRDALAEIDVSRAPDPTAIAAALGASAALGLWLRYITYDFGAIDDLASYTGANADPPPPSGKSPAHRNAAERAEELRIWRRFGMATLSFATVGARPFRFPGGQPVPRWELLKWWTYPDATPATGAANAMDFVYRYAYRACAGGPFAIASGTPAQATWLGSAAPRTIEVWDNDGIVNAASMLWPNGIDTRVVEADHGDIIGHYRRRAATPPSPRRCHTYDLLRSASEFDAITMRRVWNEVFDFCARALSASRAATRSGSTRSGSARRGAVARAR